MQLHPITVVRAHRILFGAAILMILMILNVFPAHAALPPVNDECSGAIVIPSTGPTPFVAKTALIDISGATVSPNDPPMPPSDLTGFDTNISHSVWFRFTPSTTGIHTISTGPDTDTAFRDTTMIVYTAPQDCGPFSIYTYNEDSGTLRASVSTNFSAGTTYYIVVWVGRLSQADISDNETLDLQVRVSKPEIPVNDNCAGALEIPSTLTPSYLSPIIDTTLATTTPNLRAQCVVDARSVPSRDVWFRFTPAVSGSYIVSTASDTASSLGNDGTLINDTAIGIFTLPSGCGQTASQQACNDNGQGRAILSVNLTANTTYYIVVWDNAADYVPGETALRLRVSPSTQPTAITGPLLSISSTGAVLGATVNANGVLSRFWFEWGPTTSLGSTSAVKILFAGATTFITNIVVSGFQPNTDYFYTIVATNALGRTTGIPNTFRWNSAPPADVAYFNEGPGISQVEFEGTPFHNYLVQGSTNLVHWTDLGLAFTNRSGSISAFQFRHAQAPPVAPQYFYRLRLP